MFHLDNFSIFMFLVMYFLACFLVTLSENFKCFQYFNFEIDFLENEDLFQKTGVPFFSWKH